jgi:hypothetical protein
MTRTYQSDAELGRQAAEQVIHGWGSELDLQELREKDSIEFGNAAVAHLADYCKSQPSLFRASREGAQRGAETLSARPFQGILEVLQNADDVQATEVRLAFRENSGRTELLIVHDGTPLSLTDVTAMTVPWVTTKTNDPALSGRFGIGQMTLLALGRPIDAHCHPYHFRVAETVPIAVTPEQPIPGIYDPAKRETLLVIPVDPEYRSDQLEEFLEEIGSRSLIFLKSVRRIALLETESNRVVNEIALEHNWLRSASVEVRRQALVAEVVELIDAENQRFIRYMVEAPVANDELRQNKATDELTVLGVAVPTASEPGGIFDRIPLPAPYGFPASLNAQFDPDTARSAMQENSWNAARFADLGDLLASAIIDINEHDPAVAWNAVPLRDEILESSTEWLKTQYTKELIDRVHNRLRNELRLGPEEDRQPLTNIAYEEHLLDGILSDDDQKSIAPDHATVSCAERDNRGRWREVLDALGLSYLIDVRDALEVLEMSDEELGHRPPQWFVDFGAAAVEAECFADFCELPTVVLANGQRIKAPGQEEPRSLVRRAEVGLAARLNIALPINDAYLTTDDAATSVASELEAYGLLRQSVDSDIAALRLLARGCRSTVRLEDDAVFALRDAFERTMERDQESLGPQIGKAIELRGFHYEQGKSEQTWVSPTAAYLPLQIEREKYCFANAAAKTPGIIWLANDYARLLKRTDRQGLGPQSFLRKLGAEIVPRLDDPRDEFQKYQRDPRLVREVHVWAMPGIQATEIRALPGHVQYLIDDKFSHDLDAVIEDIIGGKTAEDRRRRAKALLTVLVRGWERYYSKHTVAKSVIGSGGYWNVSGTVISTWLARAASEPWLPSATGKLRPPSELHLATEANRLSEGDSKSAYLMPVDEHVAKSSALAALRIRQGPSADKVVSRLEELCAVATDDLSDAERRGIQTAYRLLALACPRGENASASRTVDDLPVSQLRSRFDGETTGSGLIFSGSEWHRPSQVRRGPAIFGNRRPFVPDSAQLERLWITLQVALPSARDAIEVLRELEAPTLSDSDKAIVIESMRLLAREVESLSPQVRARLKKLPLWVGKEWVAERPIYAVDDETVAAALREEHPVWMPGFRFDRHQALLEALDVTYIEPDEFEPIVNAGYGAADGNTLRTRFAIAVQHLRNELARDDQELSKTLITTWEELATAGIVIDSELEITASLPGRRPLTAMTKAHLVRQPVTLFARSVAEVGSAESGGRAIATLFEGDRQKLAWAWEVMWQRSESGDVAERIVLSTDSKEQNPDDDRLARLQDQSSERRTGATRQARKGSAPVPAKQPAIKTRVLKDLNDLVPAAGRIINRGAAHGGVALPAVRPERPSDIVTASSKAPAAPAEKAVLPPMSDREQLAYDAVKMALALEDEQIEDLRHRRGIGADAVDELRQFFEIKMASGAEFPNDVTLTPKEAGRARENPDFFLAVVAGLEDNAGKLRVRFIFDPLRQLQLKLTNDITLTGVRDAEALEHEFNKGGPVIES